MSSESSVDKEFSEVKQMFLADTKKASASQKKIRHLMDCKMGDMTEKVNMDWTLCFNELKDEMTPEQKKLYDEILRITKSLKYQIERQMEDMHR